MMDDGQMTRDEETGSMADGRWTARTDEGRGTGSMADGRWTARTDEGRGLTVGGQFLAIPHALAAADSATLLNGKRQTGRISPGAILGRPSAIQDQPLAISH